jgi:hypothetical protein
MGVYGWVELADYLVIVGHAAKAEANADEDLSLFVIPLPAYQGFLQNPIGNVVNKDNAPNTWIECEVQPDSNVISGGNP